MIQTLLRLAIGMTVGTGAASAATWNMSFYAWTDSSAAEPTHIGGVAFSDSIVLSGYVLDTSTIDSFFVRVSGTGSISFDRFTITEPDGDTVLDMETFGTSDSACYRIDAMVCGTVFRVDPVVSGDSIDAFTLTFESGISSCQRDQLFIRLPRAVKLPKLGTFTIEQTAPAGAKLLPTRQLSRPQSARSRAPTSLLGRTKPGCRKGGRADIAPGMGH